MNVLYGQAGDYMADCNFNTAISELHKFTHKIVDAIEAPDTANAPEVGWPACFECLPLFDSVCFNLPRVYLQLLPPASTFFCLPLSASVCLYLLAFASYRRHLLPTSIAHILALDFLLYQTVSSTFLPFFLLYHRRCTARCGPSPSSWPLWPRISRLNSGWC
jgi:hypothetical protein